jgi:exodeoxyribonuclease V alpha subunit
MMTIRTLQRLGFFGPMDVQVAGLLSRMDPTLPTEALQAAALASRAISLGHACVDLKVYAGRSWQSILETEVTQAFDRDVESLSDLPGKDDYQHLRPLPASLEQWLQQLPVTTFGHGQDETDTGNTLLVRNGSRITLRRYWEYERIVSEKLIALKQENTERQVSDAQLAYTFTGSDDQHEQREAARKAVNNRLTLLSGGPGTGKTYTLARAVALISELSQADDALNIRMVAPTGKAAARMSESMRKAKASLQDEFEIQNRPTPHLDTIPENATTIHRLLGARYHSPYFKHDASNPIAADMVIVDEASMVDLPLMAKLLDALPEQCSLMLVGDIDQLASVEPGRVYGDLCHAAEDGGPLDGCLTRLTKSWRFPDTSTIGIVSRLVNQGEADAAWHALQTDTDNPYITWHDTATLDDNSPELIAFIRAHLKAFVAARTATEALDAASTFRILCALRKGPHGVDAMNRLVEKVLGDMGLSPKRGFYDHQLVMIKSNTPSQNLFNGDIGVVLRKADDEQAYVAWFSDSDGAAPRSIPVSLLPDHETAFAMTIHKSQGLNFPTPPSSYLTFPTPQSLPGNCSIPA